MKTGLFGALLGCGAVFGWAWSTRPGPAEIEVSAAGRGVHPSRLLEQPLGTLAARSAQPVIQRSRDLAVQTPVESSSVVEAPPAPSPAAAEHIARRYFHAVVVVEELAALLPAEDETNPRTRERFPGCFAALDERSTQGAQFACILPPMASEALPSLDLAAGPADFERIYRSWSREDLLVEKWRIDRFAYAESRRLLENQFDLLGPLPSENSTPQIAFG